MVTSYPRAANCISRVIDPQPISTLHVELCKSDEESLGDVFRTERHRTIQIFVIVRHNHRTVNLSVHFCWKVSFAQVGQLN